MSSADDYRENDRVFRAMIAALQHFQRRLADRTGLNTTDLSLLLALDAADGPLTAGALAQAADITSGAATTAIDRLVKAGLAQRKRTEEDRRAVMVVIRRSEARKALALIEPLLAARRSLWAEFDARERQAIVRFMHRTVEMAEEWAA